MCYYGLRLGHTQASIQRDDDATRTKDLAAHWDGGTHPDACVDVRHHPHASVGTGTNLAIASDVVESRSAVCCVAAVCGAEPCVVTLGVITLRKDIDLALPQSVEGVEVRSVVGRIDGHDLTVNRLSRRVSSPPLSFLGCNTFASPHRVISASPLMTGPVHFIGVSVTLGSGLVERERSLSDLAKAKEEVRSY